MLKAGIPPENIVLESKHPNQSRAEIDCVVLEQGAPSDIFEFKYDRANPGGTNQPAPQKAGALFKDLIRVMDFPPPTNRHMIYLTDSEMASYLSSPRNGFREFFGLPTGGSLRLDEAYFRGRSNTFHRSMGKWPRPADVQGLFADSLPGDHHLKILKILE